MARIDTCTSTTQYPSLSPETTCEVEGATPASGPEGVVGSAPNAGSTVDVFDDVAAGGGVCAEPQSSQAPFAGPTIKASQLAYAPQKALELTQAAAPKSSGDTATTLKGPVNDETPITSESTPAKAPTGTRPVHVDAPWISQYAPDVELKVPGTNRVIPNEWPESVPVADRHGMKTPRDAACAAACDEMLKRGGAEYANTNINIAETRDPQGRFTTTRAKADQAHGYIDSQLDSGKPVMVGVMWNTPLRRKDSHGERPKPLNDNNADHFVVITGRGIDDQGREYYSFSEPGAGADRKDIGPDTRPENRFYVDENTGILYRPAVKQSGYTSDARYEVSRVSVNK